MANQPNDSSATINNYHENEIPDPELVEESPFVYDDPELPSGIASEIPEHVYRFEKAWQDSKRISIYELLKKPFFLPEKELDDDPLKVELERIRNLMEENQVSLEIPSCKDPREIYRFITEFLFDQEIDDLKLDGLSRHFIYNSDYAQQ